MMIDIVYQDNDEAESVAWENRSDTNAYEDEWPQPTRDLKVKDTSKPIRFSSTWSMRELASLSRYVPKHARYPST